MAADLKENFRNAVGFLIINLKIKSQPVSEVVKDIAIAARGLGFNSQAGQIRHTVANGLSYCYDVFS